MVVGKAHLEIAQALGAYTTTVFLSRATIQKQQARHGDMPISYYLAVKACLHNGQYERDGERQAVILFVDPVLFNTNFRAAIKATQNGAELYLTSFLRLKDKKYRRELRQCRPLIRGHL